MFPDENDVSPEDIEVALATGVDADKAVEYLLENDELHDLTPENIVLFFEKAVEMNSDLDELSGRAIDFIDLDDMLDSNFTDDELFAAREKVNDLMVSQGVYKTCGPFADKLLEECTQKRSDHIVPRYFNSKDNEAKWIQNMKLVIEHEVTSRNFEDDLYPLRLGLYYFNKGQYLESAKYFKKENEISKNAEACAHLSHMYEKGKGLKQNLPEAFRLAYEIGNSHDASHMMIEIDDDVAELIGYDDDDDVIMNGNRLFKLLQKMDIKDRMSAMSVLDGQSKENDGSEFSI